MTKHNLKKTSALKKARKFFQRNNISETEDSDSSVESQENSHVPLRTEVPSLANLFLERDDNMDQIAAQLNQISQQLQQLTTRQTLVEQRLNADLPDDEINSEEEINEIGPVNTQNVMESLSRIPDPIKSIPSFDGNPKQLNAWIISAENTLKIFKPLVPVNVFAIYEQSVIHKLQGKAKDAICMAQYPLTFEETKRILKSTLGDKKELSSYKSKLWKNKQTDSMTVHKYYQRTQYLVENIKMLAKQDKDYAKSWPAISKFIDQDALAAFVSGLNEFYFGHALAARPKTLEDAYAFLCEFTSSERIARGERKNETTNSRQTKEQIHRNDNYKKNKFNYNNNPPKVEKQDQEPMEIDPSIRSRITLNRKIINNHEMNSESEDENVIECDVNFQQASSSEDPE